MKLYAVTKGDYSAYHIIALTADKDVAGKLAKKYSNRTNMYGDGFGEAKVEEYEDGVALLDRDCYFVRVENGNVTEVVPPNTEDTWFFEEDELYNDSVQPMKSDTNSYYTHVLARNADEAAKIGKDRIMQHIASRELE